MSKKPHVSVSWERVHAFRVLRSHLRERAPQPDLVSVVDDIAGIQAQLMPAAQIALWARVGDLQLLQIDEALKNRTLVKASCMRRTLFLIPAEHLAIYVRGSARRAEKEVRWTRGKGVPDRLIERAIEAALGALDEPRTRPEIAARASRALGVQARAVQGGGWGSRRKLAAVPVGHLRFPVVDLLHLAGARGVVCYGPPHGSEPTFVRADAWIPGWQDVSQEDAENLLLRRYLRAFAPATAADFAMWTGMTVTEAREIWKRSEIDFAPVSVQGWQGSVLREDLEQLVAARLAQPHVRLLPYFDTFLLGHKEREHLVDSGHRASVYRPQGWIAPVVLVGGRVAGVWEHARERDRLRVRVVKFGSLSHRVISRVHQEAEGLARFLIIPSAEVETG